MIPEIEKTKAVELPLSVQLQLQKMQEEIDELKSYLNNLKLLIEVRKWNNSN